MHGPGAPDRDKGAAYACPLLLGLATTWKIMFGSREMAKRRPGSGASPWANSEVERSRGSSWLYSTLIV